MSEPIEADRHELVKENGAWECQAAGCPFADADDHEAIAHAVANQAAE